jgi:hypothetical protein
MSNKKIFNIQNIDVVKFSSSLGLVTAPRIRFLQKSQQNKGTKDKNGGLEESDDNEEDEPLNFTDITGSSVKRNGAKIGNDDDDLFTVKQVFKFKPNLADKNSAQSDDQSDEDNNVSFVLSLS